MTFGALFTQVLGFFTSRFQITYFLPSFIFWALLIVVWYAGQGSVAAAAGLWSSAQGTHWIVVVGFFAWLVIFASILASQSSGLVRLYEGYWTFPGGAFLRNLGQRWHQAELARLEEQPDGYREIYWGYPLHPEFVMPTRLGNILRNSELHSWDRYGIDAVVAWPRLYNTFSSTFAQALLEVRTGLDFMLVISFLSFVFAFLSGSYLVVIGSSPGFFLLCFGGGLVAGWIAYLGALGNAVFYSQQVKAAFDLYRNELLKQMRIALPTTLDAERTTWTSVNHLLYRVRPSKDLTYTTPPSS